MYTISSLAAKTCLSNIILDLSWSPGKHFSDYSLETLRKVTPAKEIKQFYLALRTVLIVCNDINGLLPMSSIQLSMMLIF